LPEPFDVCIIGGGPAGASLALRLAKLGRSVAVIEKASFPRRHVGESLTGGVLPLLQVLGVLPQIESGQFLKAPHSTVLWGGQLNSKETHGGYQVDRGVFDGILLREARSAGALVMQPARVLDVSRGEQWSIDLQEGVRLQARFVAVAAGRSPILGGKKIPFGARTIALYAYWGGVDPERGETLVEAGPSQWYWGAPLPDGTFNATVFVDTENAKKEHYLNLIHQSNLLSPRLRSGACGEIHACDATSFLSKEVVASDSIRVGDAAVTIDPLSSQGVQTAIGTALHAAIVINTILDRPGESEMAMDFYRRRLADSAQFHAHTAAQQYREEWAISPTPFWERRIAAHGAWERRSSAKLTTLDQPLCVSPRVTFVPVATATENYVVASDGMMLDGEVFCRLGEHSVSKLLSQIADTMLAREVLQRWSQQMPTSTAIGVLEWAWGHGLLEPPAIYRSGVSGSGSAQR
jgi:flavin-dependent dehydrogenase